MSVAMAVRGCCSTAWSTVLSTQLVDSPGRQGRGAVPSAESKISIWSGRCSTALPCSPTWLSSPALLAGSGFPLPELNPFPETLLSGSGQGRSRDLGGFKRLGKNLPPGISFLRLPGINCAMEVEALQLHGAPS